MTPAITNYIQAIDGNGDTFRTLGPPELRRDEYGVPEMIAGNSAVVFPYTDPQGRSRFLKCYIRPNPLLKTIYDYVERKRPRLLPEARMLTDELFVDTPYGLSRWVDVVEGEWTEGETLAKAISQAAGKRNRERLGQLADAFDRLMCELDECEWAHGDLKPENIIVAVGGELRLIDCDAMWIPELRGTRPAELGTPPWRDPAREAGLFDKTIDRYPANLITATLRLLELYPTLWPGYSRFEELVSKISTSPEGCQVLSRGRGSTSGSARG